MQLIETPFFFFIISWVLCTVSWLAQLNIPVRIYNLYVIPFVCLSVGHFNEYTCTWYHTHALNLYLIYFVLFHSFNIVLVCIIFAACRSCNTLDESSILFLAVGGLFAKFKPQMLSIICKDCFSNFCGFFSSYYSYHISS